MMMDTTTTVAMRGYLQLGSQPSGLVIMMYHFTKQVRQGLHCVQFSCVAAELCVAYTNVISLEAKAQRGTPSHPHQSPPTAYALTGSKAPKCGTVTMTTTGS